MLEKLILCHSRTISGDKLTNPSIELVDIASNGEDVLAPTAFSTGLSPTM